MKVWNLAASAINRFTPRVACLNRLQGYKPLATPKQVFIDKHFSGQSSGTSKPLKRSCVGCNGKPDICRTDEVQEKASDVDQKVVLESARIFGTFKAEGKIDITVQIPKGTSISVLTFTSQEKSDT